MILDRFRLTDRAAIVTGAGRGIGAATAIALAQAGSDVVIAARTETQLSEVAAQIEAAGRKAVVVPADLNDLDVMAQLVDGGLRRLRRGSTSWSTTTGVGCPAPCSTSRPAISNGPSATT